MDFFEAILRAGFEWSYNLSDNHPETEEFVNISRPMHLNLFKMKFPPMAIMSILHRLSGVVLFLLLPFVLYLLHHSLQSENSFLQLQTVIGMPFVRFLSWILISSVGLHLFAGIRHMMMDCGWGESIQAGRATAYGVMLLELVVMIVAGIGLW